MYSLRKAEFGGPEQSFVFSDDFIVLDVPKEGIIQDQWKVIPAKPPKVAIYRWHKIKCEKVINITIDSKERCWWSYSQEGDGATLWDNCQVDEGNQQDKTTAAHCEHWGDNWGDILYHRHRPRYKSMKVHTSPGSTPANHVPMQLWSYKCVYQIHVAHACAHSYVAISYIYAGFVEAKENVESSSKKTLCEFADS